MIYLDFFYNILLRFCTFLDSYLILIFSIFGILCSFMILKRLVNRIV